MKKLRLRENLLHFSNHWWIYKETLTNCYWCFCDVPHQSDAKINEHNHFLYNASKHCVYLSFFPKQKSLWHFWTIEFIGRGIFEINVRLFFNGFVISLNDFQRVFVSVINCIPHKSFIVFLSDYSKQSYCLTWFHMNQQSTLNQAISTYFMPQNTKQKLFPIVKSFQSVKLDVFGVDRSSKIDKNKTCSEMYPKLRNIHRTVEGAWIWWNDFRVSSVKFEMAESYVPHTVIVTFKFLWLN